MPRKAVKQQTLLIIADDAIEDALCQYFDDYEFVLETITPPQAIQQVIQQINPFCIVFRWDQVNNPKEFCTNLFTHFAIPIIAMSEAGDEEPCIAALAAGADDFISLPINPRELHARIKAIKRRVNPMSAKKQKNEKIVFYQWKLDIAARQLFSPQQSEIKLSTGEFNLLLAFVRNAQRILSRDELLEMTKSRSLEPFERSIDVQISRLRHKIEKDPRKPEFIKTVRCGGYLFTPKITHL